MNCPNCNKELESGAAVCTCGWKAEAAQSPTAATENKGTKGEIKAFFRNDLFRAVILAVVAIVLLRRADFLSFGYLYSWKEGFIKFIVAINGVMRLTVILGAGFLAFLGFRAALRLYRKKERYALAVFVLTTVVLLLAAISLISFLCTAVNNFTVQDYGFGDFDDLGDFNDLGDFDWTVY
jgi:hypothetical protein